MAAVDEFNSWLNSKLRASKADVSVFGSYITGILEGDENNEEKVEALEGILGAIIEADLEAFINEILDRWNTCHSKDAAEASKPKLDVEVQLAKLLEGQKLATKVEREYTEEERRIKEQILLQYSQLSESEPDEEDEEGATSSSDPKLVKNTNFADVQALAREKREQAKLESQLKKEKDKQDREKQRQLREEKKEKRKTVKGERRR
uniref:Coiled-coil domain-containing protein 43 n=1 Tax=Anopheles epiroticus TaxID=199890 RepID=A0A182PJJ6_9DIPT